MDITTYRPDALLTSRDLARVQPKPPPGPVPEVDAIAGQPVEEEGFNLFGTVLDTINPLQHIPGVSTAYQAVTGDDSSALANMAGGFLFGGPVGLAAGAATSFLEFLTGKDLMDHAQAFFGGEQAVPDDGVENLETAGIQDHEALFKTSEHKGVDQYQAFATAQATQNKGFGADERQVNWSSNIWTSQALKDAAALYEQNDELATPGAQRNPEHQERIV